MSSAIQIPQPLRGDSWTNRLIRDLIWKPAVKEDDWTVFAIVGREGSGKSLTCASILRAVDPTFTIDRTHFEPVPFMKAIAPSQDSSVQRPGVAIMGDEFGVAFGKRTWHDREQVESNQALQTARDDNRIIGLTVPRVEELDSQLEGRLHLLLETTKKKDGEFVELKYKVVDPSRDGAGKVYRKYPRYHIGDDYQVKHVRIGPPPADYVQAYKRKKAAFKNDLFDKVIDRFADEVGDGSAENASKTPKQIANEIIDNGGADKYHFVANNGNEYIDDDLICADYEISARKAQIVKKLLQRDIGILGEG